MTRLWLRIDLRSGLRFDGRALLLGLAAAAALYGVFAAGRFLPLQLFGFASDQIGAIYDKGGGTPPWAIGLLLFFVTGPSEEIFCRGFLQRGLQERFGGWRGYAIATAVSGGLSPVFGTRVLRQKMIQSHVSMGSFFPSALACDWRLQADAWSHVDVGPEPGKVQELTGRPRDLEPQRVAPENDLRGDVDHLPSQGIRVGRDRDDLPADDLLERFIEKERNAHEVVEGGIGAEALKGKPLIGKLLEDAEGQLAPAAMMVTPDDPLGGEHRFETGCAELLIDPVAHAEIGVEHGAGPGKGEQKLIVFSERPREERSTESLPVVSAVAELHILPHTAVFDFFASNVTAPCFLGRFSNALDDIRVQLPAADVAHVPAFRGLEELLVHVAAVEVKNNGHILAVAASNPLYHASHHALGPMAVVAVLVPGAENRIDDKAFPGHLERAKDIGADRQHDALHHAHFLALQALLNRSSHFFSILVQG